MNRGPYRAFSADTSRTRLRLSASTLSQSSSPAGTCHSRV